MISLVVGVVENLNRILQEINYHFLYSWLHIQTPSSSYSSILLRRDRSGFLIKTVLFFSTCIGGISDEGSKLEIVLFVVVQGMVHRTVVEMVPTTVDETTSRTT